MTKTFALLLILIALSSHAEDVRVAPGDRLRIRCDGGTVTIAGGSGDIVRGPRARRVEPHVIEVVAGGDIAISAPRTIVVEWLATNKARANITDVAALHIDARGGAVTALRIAGSIDGKTANGNVTAREVGGNVVITTGNGNLIIDGVRGLVDITTGNGNTSISNTRSGVHVVSINGRTEIACVGGGVTVNDTSGQTTVTSTSGDVNLFTALGKATWDGALLPEHSYRLRTLDGAVTLLRAGGGFTAQLASDAAQIDVDPPLTKRQRRIDLRAGDERARVVLDAVGGRVELRRSTATRAVCR
jgi:hypothetical protein